MSEWKTKNGWRIIPKLSGDPRYAEYVDRMAEAQRKANPAPVRPVKPENMTVSEWILSMQEPSTKEIMRKQEDPNYQRDWSEPLPDNVLANPEAKTKEELIGARSITNEEYATYQAHRHRSKNTRGQSIESGVTEESRERGAHHFLVSPPANPTQEEILSLIEIAEGPSGIPASIPQMEWKKLPWYKAIWHWIRGGEVKRTRD